MGMMDVFAILCDNSEASKRDGVTGKPLAVAEGREEVESPRCPNEKGRRGKPLRRLQKGVKVDRRRLT